MPHLHLPKGCFEIPPVRVGTANKITGEIMLTEKIRGENSYFTMSERHLNNPDLSWPLYAPVPLCPNHAPPSPAMT
jgi:hypothetical protein